MSQAQQIQFTKQHCEKCPSSFDTQRSKQVVKRNMKPGFILVLTISSFFSLTASLKCYSCGKASMETNEYQALFQFCHPPTSFGSYIDCPNGSCFKSVMINEGTTFISRACIPRKSTGCQKVVNIFVTKNRQKT